MRTAATECRLSCALGVSCSLSTILDRVVCKLCDDPVCGRPARPRVLASRLALASRLVGSWLEIELCEKMFVDVILTPYVRVYYVPR